MRRSGIVIALAVLLVAMTAAPALATGADKQPLVGPSAVVWCSDVTPFPGEDASEAGPGFVVFNYDRDANTVMANVALKGATPNTTYVVRLIQGGSGDCFTVDGTITTNGQGNGTLTIYETMFAGAPGVQVIIDTGSMFINPTFRGADLYLLPTF